MSSMSPTLVLKEGLPYLTAGSPGGSRIPGTVLNVLLNFLHFNMSLPDAVASPRVVSRNTIADVEAGIMNKSVPSADHVSVLCRWRDCCGSFVAVPPWLTSCMRLDSA